jgi:hypothetical protein
MNEYEHTYYLETVIRPNQLRNTIELCKQALAGHIFDAIAFRGMSGALIAPTLALELHKELIMVRKPSEFKGKDATHSSYCVEGFKSSRRYVIVDDMISSGHTVCSIYRAIKEFAPHAECIGMVDYYCIKQDMIKTELERRRGLDDPTFPLLKPTNTERILNGEICLWTRDDVSLYCHKKNCHKKKYKIIRDEIYKPVSFLYK